MSKSGKVGLRQIAEGAHVSMATASRVLSGSSRVDAEIQKKVLAEASRLGINPSERNKTKTLAFLLSNRTMLHAFHSRILSGAEAHCAARGWDIVFLSWHYSPNIPWNELHPLRVIERRDVTRGVILAGTNSTNLLELLKHKGILFAVLGNNVLGDASHLESNDVVYADDIQGGLDATRYLLRLGHRHIWFVGNSRLPWFARYYEGYRRAMQEAGLPARESSTDSEDDAECGYLGTKSLLARGEQVTAIVAGNDPTAGGVYKALREKGVRIPDDVSVVGCDDTVGTWLYPALSTTREFPEQLGKNLVELVLNRIANPELDPQSVTVPTEFIRRESCGPPPRLRTESPNETVPSLSVS
ncbi:MAG TPA: LacI family DNA-binding transcriptional regulator [Acidobacteriaceae bacterium]|nr:LacI family DNA-binding transcriptional regulator [Acidobacteriaceae bacterium]